MKRTLVVVMLVVCCLILSGCNGFEKGDTVVARHDLSLYDFNSSARKVHPWVCDLTSGQNVVVVDTYNDAGELVTIVKDPNNFRCRGGSAQSNFEPAK